MPCSQPESEVHDEMRDDLAKRRLGCLSYSHFTRLLPKVFPHVTFPKYCRLGI
jgi:hypothetical protein